MTIQFYRQLVQALQVSPVVVATVIAVKGSVPREIGAKMAIQADGNLIGTIGGGAGEAKVIRQAMQVLITGEPQRVDIDLTGTAYRETQGICGGIMAVWLERWAGIRAIDLVTQILHLLQAGQTPTLVTPLEEHNFPYLLAAYPTTILPANSFVEMLQPPPALLIVGAGHVGEQLAKVAALSGFQVVVQDERPEWANAQRYPQAVKILTEPLSTTLSYLASYPQLYAALVTRGYKYDIEALTLLLQRQPRCCYIGMIGSQKRVRQVYEAIGQMSINPASLSYLYAPIGLDIGALTPEEIAVSITAELIMVRRGGTGRPLSLNHGNQVAGV